MSTRQGKEEEVVAVVKSSSKCEDCGNQAKKDCAYSRCRTCCKNKGFECQTHIRSTWTPVDRRRQRVPSPTTTTNTPRGLDVPKRHKLNPYSETGLEELKFPAAMSSMAVFSSVRVRSMDETVNEIAYQTSVNIGGHVFSGLLYDQGPYHQQQSFNDARGQSSTTATHPLVIVDQQHNNNPNLVSSAIHDGATMALPLSAMTSTSYQHFFPPPRHPFQPSSSGPGGMPYFSHPKP